MTWTAYRTTSKVQNGCLTKMMVSKTATLCHYDTKVPQKAVLLKHTGIYSSNTEYWSYCSMELEYRVNTAVKEYTGVGSAWTSECV